MKGSAWTQRTTGLNVTGTVSSGSLSESAVCLSLVPSYSSAVRGCPVNTTDGLFLAKVQSLRYQSTLPRTKGALVNSGTVYRVCYRKRAAPSWVLFITSL